MSYNTDAIRLRVLELEAIMSLYGKQTLFGFHASQTAAPETLWNAVCRLLEDGLLNNYADEYYLLREDLYEAIWPICEAGEALTLTPAGQGFVQRIYYLSDKVTVMIPVGVDSVSLHVIERPQIAAELLELEFVQPFGGDVQPDTPDTKTLPEMAREELLDGALFVLERINTETGDRLQWLRGFALEDVPWLEWTHDGVKNTTVLARRQLEQAIEQMTKGEGTP